MNFHNAHNNNASDKQLYYLHFMDKLHHWGWGGRSAILFIISIVSFPLKHQIGYWFFFFLALKLFTYCDLTNCYKVSHIPTVHFIRLLLELLFRRIYLLINIFLIVPFPEVLKRLLFCNRIWFCYGLPSVIAVQCTTANVTGGPSSSCDVAIVPIIFVRFQGRWKSLNCIIK